MNKIILIGNLTSNPETKGTQSGNTVCTFGIAVNDRRGGEDRTQFFRVSAWGKRGESCQTYLSKGKKVFVSGPLEARTYQKHDGSTGVSLEVTADEVEFLSPRDDSQQGNTYAPAVPQTSMMPVDVGDDLPF